MRPMRMLPVVLALCGCEALNLFDTTFEPAEDAAMYSVGDPKPAPDPAGTLRVMNWNIKFGGARLDFFFDCHGNRGWMSKAEVLQNLAGIAAKIDEIDPDVIFLQEADRGSKRSAYVDQIRWLLDHTAMNHGAFASQWKADYVPSDGIGRIDDGMAVLSRWPITDAKRIALPPVGDKDALERYFYLKRALLVATIAVPGVDGGLKVVVVHTEAYSHDGTKSRQIAKFKEKLDELDLAGALFVAGGDLNALPPGSLKTSEFPDVVCEDVAFRDDDYDEEGDILQPLYDTYEAEIPLADYQADNARYFSHTTDGDAFWNRKLDYLFTNGDFLPGSGLVWQDANSGPTPGLPTMPLSDHAPVSVELVLP